MSDPYATNRKVEMIVNTVSGKNPCTVSANTRVERIRRIELVEWFAAGVSTTGGISDFPVLVAQITGLGIDNVTTGSGDNGIHMFLEGENTYRQFTNREIGQQSPGTNQQLTIRILDQDGAIVDPSSYDRIWFTFRFTLQDQ